MPLAKGESIRTLGAVMQGSNQFPKVFGHEAVQTSFYDFKHIMYTCVRPFLSWRFRHENISINFLIASADSKRAVFN